jgi:hypothetical protein
VKADFEESMAVVDSLFQVSNLRSIVSSDVADYRIQTVSFPAFKSFPCPKEFLSFVQ